MKKLFGIAALFSGGVYFLLGMQLSADNWTTADKILAGVFCISVLGLLQQRTAK